MLYGTSKDIFGAFDISKWWKKIRSVFWVVFPIVFGFVFFAAWLLYLTLNFELVPK
jgi:hypothetical protein